MFLIDEIFGSGGPARRLKRGLVHGRARSLAERLSLDVLLRPTGVVTALNNMARPKGPGRCDHNGLEKIANVLTSIPFILIGTHTMQKRQTTAGKVYGGTVAGVGVASMVFHASGEKTKEMTRRMDYWACALSSTWLMRCVYPELPPAVMAVAVASIPIFPFAVSSLSTLGMEVKFHRRSAQNDALRKCQMQHNVACCAGAGLFFLEDAHPHVPLMHAGWHLMSCYSVATTNGLLLDIERGMLNEQTDDPCSARARLR